MTTPHETSGLPDQASAQPARFWPIVFTFLLVGPPVGSFVVFSIMILPYIDKPSAAYNFFIVQLFFSYLFGGAQALLTGIFVAYRAFNRQKLTRWSCVLIAFVTGYGWIILPTILSPIFGQRASLTFDWQRVLSDLWKLFLFFGLPSILSGYVCTRLTERWQGAARELNR